MRRTCSHPGCERVHYGKGYCQPHYKRMRKGADMSTPIEVRGDDDERFWAKVSKGPECWLWLGAPSGPGYGLIRYKGRYQSAHRVSYEINVGPVAGGMQIDHKCRNMMCVNPDHLRVVTDGENKQNITARANSKSGVRGVVYYPKRGKFLASVQKDGRKNYLGWHFTAEEAERAVTAWRREHMPFSEMDKVKEN